MVGAHDRMNRFINDEENHSYFKKQRTILHIKKSSNTFRFNYQNDFESYMHDLRQIELYYGAKFPRFMMHLKRQTDYLLRSR